MGASTHLRRPHRARARRCGLAKPKSSKPTGRGTSEAARRIANGWPISASRRFGDPVSVTSRWACSWVRSNSLKPGFPKIDTEVDRHEVLDVAEALWAEFSHYCAFRGRLRCHGGAGPAKVESSWARGLGGRQRVGALALQAPGGPRGARHARLSVYRRRVLHPLFGRHEVGWKRRRRRACRQGLRQRSTTTNSATC